MFIAQELRKKNIAEYLLYMWQIEDTIRAFGCSLSRICKEYIDRFDYTDEQKEEEADWFGNLIRMMNQEGCREQGHLQINMVVMQQLQELHAQLFRDRGAKKRLRARLLLPIFRRAKRRADLPDLDAEFRRCLDSLDALEREGNPSCD